MSASRLDEAPTLANAQTNAAEEEKQNVSIWQQLSQVSVHAPTMIHVHVYSCQKNSLKINEMQRVSLGQNESRGVRENYFLSSRELHIGFHIPKMHHDTLIDSEYKSIRKKHRSDMDLKFIIPYEYEAPRESCIHIYKYTLKDQVAWLEFS